MKLFYRSSFATIVLVLFSGIFGITDARAQNPLPEILKRMEVNRTSMTSLRSSIKMEKYNAQLKEKDVSEGSTIYLPGKGRDASVRIDWTKPVQETLSVVNKKYVSYTPRRGQAITGNANEAKGSGKANNALSFMNMSKEQLKANYTIKYLGQEKVSGGVPTWRLELTPKNATNFKMAEIWVDGDGMPIQTKVVEKNNDTTTILLSGLEKNANINRSQFEVILPKGTKVVK